ncbi:hypothetical protein [Poritiphilus flavus]|uniref:Uncharacterized protein n=1 Tax=Poritiphilus flavus TaxID=2697053 RepID=A0A6L9EHX1_9FLAO|nr:hypothetical protein [Poritiphilus flavus]NAS14394.1 hypothetical protein [Poritiphilus flavus]
MKKYILIQIVLLCLIGFSIPQSASSQYICESCEAYNFTSTGMVDHDGLSSTGVDGREFDLLSLYKRGGRTTPDCLVFKSPNNMDHVVVPGHWTCTPPGWRMRQIEANFEAMIKSRGKFSEYGNVRKKWFFFLEGRTPDQDAQAYIFEDQCWMRSVAWAEDGSLDDFKQTVAHECGHCYQIENMEGEDYFYHAWLDEANAEFLSTLVYPANNLEHYSAGDFDLDDTIFKQAYKFNVMLQHYANQFSIRQTMLLVRQSFKVSPGRLTRHYKSAGFDQILHEAYFTHFKGEVEDSGGGYVPREREVKLRQDPVDMIPGPAQTVDLDSIRPQRLNVYGLKLPPGYDLTINPPVSSSAPAYFSLKANELEILDWNRQVKIKGECDEEVRVMILSTHMNPRTVRGTKVTYKLKEREGCCSADLVVEENPTENELDGKFAFDYYIESTINYNTDGESNSLNMNYYVNSKDGSILLPVSFLNDNFGTSSNRSLEANAVIWLANGQLVGYVDDLYEGVKRAITIDLNQTRSDIMGVRIVKVAELLREGRSSGISPAPLPAGSRWIGKSRAYAFNQQERSDPGKINKVTAYISNESVPFSSPMPSFGFMAGYIRDAAGSNKNLAYTRFDLPNGDMFEVHLNHMEKLCATFDGAGYKKMTLGASTGAIAAMTEAEQNAFADSQNELNNQMLAMLKDMERCNGDKRCEAEVTKRMMAIQRQMQDAVYDLPEDPSLSGTAASDHQLLERDIRDRMRPIQEQIIDTEVRCDRLSRQDAACGGCMSLAVERCKDDLEDQREQLYALECQLARLKGLEDLMDNCPR